MSDSVPGFTAIKETEEAQIWASGPDNQHRRFHAKGRIKSTVVDAGNTPTTTLRGGFLLGLKASDGLLYAYDADATDGTQSPVGVLEKHTSMLDRDGAVEDKFKALLTGGIIRSVDDLVNEDLYALAVLLRTGFKMASLEPHGSAFGFCPKARYFKATDYTVVAADHGCLFVATAAANFTLPDLATVGRGFQVMFFNAADADMVITGAANTIVYGDAGGAVSTTLTFSTSNKKMGGQALMVADYASDGGALRWYPYFLPTTVTSA